MIIKIGIFEIEFRKIARPVEDRPGWDFAAMFADDWKMTTSDSRRQYWTWRRRSRGKDETKYGGAVSELPYPIDEMRRRFGEQKNTGGRVKKILAVE